MAKIWFAIDGGWQIHDYELYQPLAKSKAASDEELSEIRREHGKRGASARWQNGKRDGKRDGKPMPPDPDPDPVKTQILARDRTGTDTGPEPSRPPAIVSPPPDKPPAPIATLPSRGGAWRMPQVGAKTPAFLRVWEGYKRISGEGEDEAATEFQLKVQETGGDEDALADKILLKLDLWQRAMYLARTFDRRRTLASHIANGRFNDERGDDPVPNTGRKPELELEILNDR